MFKFFFINKLVNLFFFINIVISSNFVPVVLEVKQIFENKTFLDVKIIQGSTGHLVAQIFNGLSFDCFFSADIKNQYNVFKKNYVFKCFMYPYAFGTLVFWNVSNNINFFNFNRSLFIFVKYLEKIKIAVPNNDISPYGEMSLFILKNSINNFIVKNDLVFFENVNQAFVATNAKSLQYGFSSLSQILFFFRSDFKNFTHIFPMYLQKNLLQIFSIAKTNKFIFSRCLYDFNKSYLNLKIIYSFGYNRNFNNIFLNNCL